MPCTGGICKGICERSGQGLPEGLAMYSHRRSARRAHGAQLMLHVSACLQAKLPMAKFPEPY